MVVTKVLAVLTGLLTLLADPGLVQSEPTVLLRTSSIFLYCLPASLVFLLTAILSCYVTMKVGKFFILLYWFKCCCRQTKAML